MKIFRTIVFAITLTICSILDAGVRAVEKIVSVSPTTAEFTALPPATFTPSPSPVPVVQTPTATQTPTPKTQELFYVVQTGDTLSDISAVTGVSVEGLMAINGIQSADLIFAGQTLALKPDPEMRAIAIAEPGKTIIVVISEQKVYAYEDNILLAEFLSSTGTWQHPTVIGKYAIWIKLESTTMDGPGYYLPDVPYTMYFYQGYGLHGTYWHENFGTPMSHGCVNLKTENAEWLYNWAEVGTPVWVIP